MSIDQRNVYTPTQNITNLALNVDSNRIGDDRTNITVNFTTTPATVTVKQGSTIESNGNLYIVTGADYVFQMALATDNYIALYETTPEFKSVTLKGTYDDAKAGVYQADNVTRTIRWYIDQVEETYDINDSLQSYNKGGLKTEINSYKIDGTATKGLTVFSATQFTAIGAQLESDTFEIYKPCTFVFDFDPTLYMDFETTISRPPFEGILQIEFDGGWGANFNFTPQNYLIAGVGVLDNSPFTLSLNPGKYRVIFKNSVHYGVSLTLGIYLIGVYGQTNFDAASVINIT